jgi:hypothetical protein
MISTRLFSFEYENCFLKRRAKIPSAAVFSEYFPFRQGGESGEIVAFLHSFQTHPAHHMAAQGDALPIAGFAERKRNISAVQTALPSDVSFGQHSSARRC